MSGDAAAWSLSVDLTSYRGKWVAVKDDLVVDQDEDFSKLAKRVSREFPDAVLVQVPENEILVV